MDALRRATDSAGVRRLFESFYDLDEVQGFSVDIHERYIELFRNEFGVDSAVNDILDSALVPSAWAVECTEANYQPDLSPIFIKMYVTSSTNDFVAAHNVPRVISPGHAVFVETVTPAVGHSKRVRPLKGSISVGNAHNRHSGTLGGFVRSSNSQETYALTCNHVLKNDRHREVVQPGVSDGGLSPRDDVGALKVAIPLHSGTNVPLSAATINAVDAAIAKIDTSIGVIRRIGRHNAVRQAAATSSIQVGDRVEFYGKETGYQEAVIDSFVSLRKVDIEGDKYHFGNVFEIRPRKPMYIGALSKPGDSGSWVIRLDDKGLPELCGILFAGDGQRAYCCFIEEVMVAIQRETGEKFFLY